MSQSVKSITKRFKINKPSEGNPRKDTVDRSTRTYIGYSFFVLWK